MFRRRTMEQLNRKTREVKTIPIFTTNWYLYKTHLHPIHTKSQEPNTATEPDNHGTKQSENHAPKNKTNKKTTNFEELLMESIDEGLSLLGESSKPVVYFYLEKTYKMNRVDSPYRIEDFIGAIEKMFGTGAKILEIQIMKCLFKKADYPLKYCPQQKSLEFAEYVEAVKLAKSNCENSKHSQPQTENPFSRQEFFCGDINRNSVKTFSQVFQSRRFRKNLKSIFYLQ